MREVLVDATNAIILWESVTGETKLLSQKKSGLWRVYLDRSTLQARTLE